MKKPPPTIEYIYIIQLFNPTTTTTTVTVTSTSTNDNNNNNNSEMNAIIAKVSVFDVLTFPDGYLMDTKKAYVDPIRRLMPDYVCAGKGGRAVCVCVCVCTVCVQCFLVMLQGT